MKKALILIVMLCCGIATLTAQTKKEQKAAAKELQQQIEQYTKEGWVVSPGGLSLADQVRRAKAMQLELDDNGEDKYIVGTGQSIGKNYDAAKMQALEMAKQEIIRKMQTELVGIIENDLSNTQEEADDAESVATTVLSSKGFINQRLGRVITLMECYRTLPNKNKEVLVTVACNSKTAYDSAKSEVKKQLENRNKRLHDQIDAMMGQ